MLRTLETFVAIHRHGTFSRAGARIGLTQSAISAQMKRLEVDLDVALFVRSQRHATLTDEGRRLLPLAEQLLELAARIPSLIRQESPGGRLRVGAIASVQSGLLPDAISNYKAEFPAVDLQILPGVSMQLLDWADTGAIDLALLVRPPFALPRELRWQALWREPYVLISPNAQQQDTVQQLLMSQPFIRYDRSAYGGRLVQAFLARHRITVRDGMELDDLEAIVRMVERGLGVSLIPVTHALQLNGRLVRICPLGKDTFYREIGLITGHQRDTDVICNAFIDTLKRLVPLDTSPEQRQ